VRRAAQGFTLVETLLATAVGLLLTGIIATIASSNAKTYVLANSVSELETAGRVAFETIQRDVRMAGFQGCSSSGPGRAPLQNQIALQADAAWAPDAPLTGYEARGRGWRPMLPADAGMSPLVGTDVLSLQVAVGAAYALRSAMTDPTAGIPLGSVAGIAVGDRLLIADCTAAAVFEVTGVAGRELQHAAGANSSNRLPRAFGVDALALRIETHRYFVAPSAGQSPAGERSLWLKVDQRPPVQVAGGVQDLQLTYGIDSNGDAVPDRFVAADQIGASDWPAVCAIDLNLLLRGPAALRAASSTPYVFNGRQQLPADQRLYRVHRATIERRNSAT
jgi:type IV pilus assembly protein PilW